MVCIHTDFFITMTSAELEELLRSGTSEKKISSGAKYGFKGLIF